MLIIKYLTWTFSVIHNYLYLMCLFRNETTLTGMFSQTQSVVFWGANRRAEIIRTALLSLSHCFTQEAWNQCDDVKHVFKLSQSSFKIGDTYQYFLSLNEGSLAENWKKKNHQINHMFLRVSQIANLAEPDGKCAEN